MARVLDFSDGFESASAPVAGAITSSALKAFANDAAFVTDKGSAATVGDNYFNTTLNAERIFDGSAWFSNEGGDDVDIINRLSLDKADVASSATINALTNSKSFIRITGSTPTTINGIAAPASGIEKVLLIANVTNTTVTLTNQNGSASAADRIITLSGASVVLSPNQSVVLIYDTTQTRWIFFTGMSDVSHDSSPELGGDLDVNGNSIVSSSNGSLRVAPHGTGRVQLSNAGSSGQHQDIKYFHSLSISASTTAVLSSLTFDTTLYKSQIVEYQIREGTTNATRVGTLYISADGAAAGAATIVDVVDFSGDTADVGLSWAGAMNSNNAEISYTKGSNAASMHCVVKRFLS